MENIKDTQFMKFIDKMRASNGEEEDMDMLMSLMTPLDDEEEAGNAYRSILGYNPITYHTEKTVDDILDSIYTEIPESKAILSPSNRLIKETIIDAIGEEKPIVIALSMYDTIRSLCEGSGIDMVEVKDIIQATLGLSMMDMGDMDDVEDLLDLEEEEDDDIYYEEDEETEGE